MTTLVFIYFKSVESSKVVEDGQVATTSSFHPRSESRVGRLRGERHLRRTREALSEPANDAYYNNPVVKSTVSSETRQRYKERHRNRHPSVDRLTKERLKHRQRLKRRIQQTFSQVTHDVHRLQRELGRWKNLTFTADRAQNNYDLCSTSQREVQMSAPGYIYYPAKYHEVRCSSPDGSSTVSPKHIFQTCLDGVFRCVQKYDDLYFTKVKLGETMGAVVIVPKVPVACQCMWPQDQYAHLEL